MTARLNHFETAPALTKALMDASMAAYKTSIDPLIKSLIDIRASQLNGCAFCQHMHAAEARHDGEQVRLVRIGDVPLSTVQYPAIA